MKYLKKRSHYESYICEARNWAHVNEPAYDAIDSSGQKRELKKSKNGSWIIKYQHLLTAARLGVFYNLIRTNEEQTEIVAEYEYSAQEIIDALGLNTELLERILQIQEDCKRAGAGLPTIQGTVKLTKLKRVRENSEFVLDFREKGEF